MFNNKISGSNPSVSQSYQSSGTSTVANYTSSNNSTIGLEKGQIIHGEVTDLRNQEVSVKLEDGRILSGKLEEVNNLSIGDRVTFKVEDVSLKNLTLKIISNGINVTKDTTIDKALELAGLSKNIRNQSIVSELLNQQMPIDKNTIMLLIKQSVLYKDVPISTLVSMNKFHMPITEANIAQYESYKNLEHSMMTEMNQLVENIPKFFETNINIPYNEYLNQSKNLLNLILNETAINNANSEHNINPITPNELATSNTANSALLTTASILTPEESQKLSDMLEQLKGSVSSINNELITSIRNGSAKIEDIANALKTLFEQNNELNPTDLDLISLLKETTAVQTLFNTYESIPNYNNEISSYLSSADRLNLLTLLDNFSPTGNLREQITSGNITSNELLKWISTNLSNAQSEDVKTLLSSKEYKLLVQEEILSKWTFTPESIKKEGEIDKHFDNLYQNLTQIKEFAEGQTNNNFNNTISNQASHLQDNINFMNTLNSIFTYIQLPLKLKNQTANGELYVYTKKKEGRTAKDGISVLLHLDMDHLGPIDVYLELHNRNVVSKFYLKDSESYDLISSNINTLEQILMDKGYVLKSEILNQEKEVNVIEDFLNQDVASSSVARYNFDLRA
ncbi:MAG: hypothetical protein K0S41_3650 [Anaerocolumna sp.]|nr:hypothetical protein [Anaerocolumna sp.]